MTRWLALAALCAPAAAVAQPVTRPGEIEPCRVTIAYAPDEVRAEIDAWVRAEPRCERELEVRVVPTDDGLYLQARDARGRVRERVVPDAQSAAVLVVSWMADDSLGPTHAPLLEPPSAATIDAELPPDMDGLAAVAVAPSARTHARRQLILGALGSEETGGVRAQIDLFAGKRWSIGVGGGWRANHEHEDDDDESGRVAQARLLFSTTRSFGRVSLRLQLGVGIDATKPDRMEHEDRMETRHGVDGVAPRAEAAVFAAFDIAHGWGLVGGPLVEKGRGDDKPTFSLFLGVQRGL
jgi:hypothetical protein